VPSDAAGTFLSLSTQKAIVAEIETEHALIATNRECARKRLMRLIRDEAEQMNWRRLRPMIGDQQLMR